MARAKPVPTALPLGGRMVGAQEPLPFGLVCPRHGGPEAVAWQPSGLRGHASATRQCAVKAACRNVNRPLGIQVPSEPLELSTLDHSSV